MIKRTVVDIRPGITRVALLEDEKLIEAIIEDEENISIVGNIYTAEVKNILPSQFAFLDIGEEKNAFLHLTDRKEQKLYAAGADGKPKLTLKRGQAVPVQVMKDGVGNKGPNVTTQLSFTGFLVVVLYTGSNVTEIGVSQKIEDEDERERLRGIVAGLLPPSFGAIIRTQAREASEEALGAEIQKLCDVAGEVVRRSIYTKAPAILHLEHGSLDKALRELVTPEVDEVLVNSEEEAGQAAQVLESIGMGFSEKVKVYQEGESVFQRFGVELQLAKALKRKVWLKSGGFITIERTEAAVVIDVNTGKFTGNKNHGETVLLTNIEAATEIAYQIRLRNLSGMIIIDFIDIREEENRRALQEYLTKILKRDRININIEGVTRLGLFLLTRKKIRKPLEEVLCRPCEHCGGTGKVSY